MNLAFLHLRRHLRRPHCHQHYRTFIVLDDIKWVSDRALDHAVERERNLNPLLILKNLIKSEPTKTLPLSIITEKRQSLGILLRPIELIRTYPSVFEEFLPGGIQINPHVKLTPEVLHIDSEEQLVYQSDTYKKKVADRLLKLLMLGRTHKLPLHIIDRLSWDLGLPQDYIKSIVPEFPDYFQVTHQKNGDSSLELVCWSDELAVSSMEKMAMSKDRCYQKGNAIAFPVQYSRGFEIDKKFNQWVEEWQKLPFISPYENASHLPGKSDESNKWAVAIIHELLNLFVSKKTRRDNILSLGDYMGIRSKFKSALLQHPGIFYRSNKIGRHTVVLKEGYKRGLLIENDTLMDIRYKYIHLMKTKTKKSKANKREKSKDSSSALAIESKEDEDDDDDDISEDFDCESETENDDSEDEKEGSVVVEKGKGKRNGMYENRMTASNPRDRNSKERNNSRGGGERRENHLKSAARSKPSGNQNSRSSSKKLDSRTP
ncbi:protein WHAT'S THIS FACTOR 9, mitochondrial [Impatiens glandulifera]|uniref:protein WHAT'S THIS FACTOR 9, mitochondrial n=1 Tax=Impatiens glandulifera TaxID=253017 RepID=UPI001FB0C67D|nr:protein WHAT'S THIS FACTOR 9, mitochondrial [Impatiens glandulifera]